MGLECTLREDGHGINEYGIGFWSGQGDRVGLKERGR